MDEFMSEVPKHKKKKKKRSPRKADHKHEYVLVEKEKWVSSWFNYKKECKICGKVTTEFHIEKE